MVHAVCFPSPQILKVKDLKRLRSWAPLTPFIILQTEHTLSPGKEGSVNTELWKQPLESWSTTSVAGEEDSERASTLPVVPLILCCPFSCCISVISAAQRWPLTCASYWRLNTPHPLQPPWTAGWGGRPAVNQAPPRRHTFLQRIQQGSECTCMHAFAILYFFEVHLQIEVQICKHVWTYTCWTFHVSSRNLPFSPKNTACWSKNIDLNWVRFSSFSGLIQLSCCILPHL